MMDLEQAARAATCERRGANVVFSGVATDSRSVGPGELFVALRGPRFDGHAFVAAAAERGAAAALVEAAWADGITGLGPLPLLVATDTRLALGRLARAWRARFSLPVVALTGSSGKTTVKEMLAAVLAEAAAAEDAVLATRGNLNNDIGVPLTLLRLRETHRYAVVEMGMNHAGEIAYLTRLAEPVVALINNAGRAHLEGLGSVEAVARAKGEIFEGLRDGGIAVINADDAYAGLWRKLAGSRRVIDFGLERPAAVGAEAQLRPEGTELLLRLPDGTARTRLAVPGLHNVRNALAAAAVAVALNVPPEAIGRGLAKFRGIPGRLTRVAAIHGATLIDDTYNANPDSVKAALAVLAAVPGTRLFVLGDMGELGASTVPLHEEIGRAARDARIDGLYALGEHSRHAVRAYGPGARHFERIEELLAEVENRLAPDVTVLVKGSRFMRMERVVQGLRLDAPATVAGR
ncbi:UDP-N-acetylmuramoyl-tripeptide--D-alanyl-D-alanine ligase [Pelomicrobium methylotrophicum]|uniref:UDP-N-acetylmuramoyl-tripeptide--D-alanyl-D-alanine ligase n=1 Tax=Pelomicrobium methylotrophicum TaxID=2602750 RepID=A0A5C7EPA6_9PROT|nr:UDP-N-acetylmuramoyl-tripeptide--D-alanyl-D-alanine ligase [Pelomicrobium methylotrophicum]TXF13177.1 UDP-N-acetylmuramoyl-tripeptide--D-alanyl-D-alanine ligase [Pelomicrobium methylotrophicum]